MQRPQIMKETIQPEARWCGETSEGRGPNKIS